MTCGLRSIPECKFKDKPFTFPPISHHQPTDSDSLLHPGTPFVSSPHSPQEIIFNDQFYDYVEFNANGHWQYNKRAGGENPPEYVQYDDSDNQWYDDSMKPISDVIYGTL